MEGQIATFTSSSTLLKDLPRELHAFYPQIDNILVANAEDWNTTINGSSQSVLVLNAHSTMPLSNADKSKIEEWLRQRTQSKRVKVVMETEEPNQSSSAFSH